jgi:hypothetical protein
VEGQEGKTKLAGLDYEYTFHMIGCIGGLMTNFNPDAIVGGIERGLASIVELSEAGQKSK